MADQTATPKKRDPMYWLIEETKQRISKVESTDEFCKLADVLIRGYNKYMEY